MLHVVALPARLLHAPGMTAAASPVGAGRLSHVLLRIVLAWIVAGFVLPVAASLLWVRYVTDAGEWSWVYVALACFVGTTALGPAAVYWSLRRVGDDLAGRTALLTLVGLLLTSLVVSLIRASGVALVVLCLLAVAPPTVGRLLALQTTGRA